MATVVGVLPALAIGYWLSVSLPDSTQSSESIETASSSQLESTRDTPEAEVTAPPLVDFPAVGSGPRPAGVWAWEELLGGECVRSFDGAFVAEFEVVGCGQPHAAEFHRAQLLDNDPDVDYPGDQFVRDKASDVCEQWDLADLNNPERYDDLVVVPSYSIGQAQWEKGQRVVGCFIYRESGQLLDDQLVD
jgi:hypothetical protein